MKNKIYIIILSVLCLSCKHSNVIQKESNIQINIQNISPIKLSELVNNFKLVKLQTTEQSLFEDIRNIDIYDNKIYLSDGYTIKIFNLSDGVFIDKLDKRGKGPDEYITISSFIIDPKNSTLIVSDLIGQAIIYYSLNGHFIKKCRIGFWANDIHKTDTNNLLLYCGNRKDDLQNTKLALISNCKKSDSYLPISDNRKYLNVISNSHFYSYNDTTLFYEPFNDTIYSFFNNRLKIRYTIDYSGKNIEDKIYSKNYNDVSEFITELKKHNYAYGVSSFLETDTNIFLSFSYKKRHYALYDKINKNSIVFNEIIDDINFASIKLDITFRDFNIYINNGCLIYFIQPKFIIENKDKIISKDLQIIASTLNEDDNYILSIAKLK